MNPISDKAISGMVSRWLTARGYRRGSLALGRKLILKDWKYRNEIPMRFAIAAYRQGFSALLLKNLRAADIEPSSCMPDLWYAKAHPINGQFGIWIDDKLTLKYMLRPFDELLPKYFLYLDQGGGTHALMDCPSSVSPDADGVVSLLRERKRLVLKKVSGSYSAGFHRLDFVGNEFMLDGRHIAKSELTALLSSLRKYLVTEHLVAHPLISRWYPQSANIIRLVVSNCDGQSPHLFAAYIRIGQARTGVVELADWGGLFASVGLSDGKIDRGLQFEGAGFKRCDVHPDSGETIDGYVPHWDEILVAIREIGLYLPNLRYVGWDVIVEQSGFRFIEGNSWPGIGFIQMFYPFLSDSAAAELFGPYCERP